MRVNRGLLFWGVALIIAGLIPLAVQQGVIERESLTDIWRLWPLVLVALGFALILSRTPLAALGTLTAAVIVGVAGGAALTLGPGLAVACGVGEPTEPRSDGGTLPADAAVNVSFNCGTLDIGLAPGNDWRLDARGAEPRVDANAERLTLATPEGIAFAAGRQVWDLTLPEATADLRVDANAARSRVNLTDGAVSRLRASINAGDARFDLTDVEVDDIDVSLNAGSLTIAGNHGTRLAGHLGVNAGSIDICAPDDAVVVIRSDGNVTFSHNLADAGLVEVAEDSWRRGEGAPALDLRVSGNAASFNLLDEEGCD
jgi:hypothetical protein